MNKLLLPNPWKTGGYLLTGCGSALAILYFFFDFKFKMDVFAIYSSFLETKMFAIIRTNVADELILLLLLAGMGLIIFSKEKIETPHIDAIRTFSLVRALLFNIIFLFLTILFVYGSGFITVLVINLLIFPLLYLFFFHIHYRKEKNKIV
jgi:hypothetical protein